MTDFGATYELFAMERQSFRFAQNCTQSAYDQLVIEY